eukprot:Trichotokara_eunicae@DN5291_c0_g1_i2.p1
MCICACCEVPAPRNDWEGKVYAPLALLQMIIPGWGFIGLGHLRGECGYVCLGLLQFLFVPFGWLWAWVTGVFMAIQYFDYREKQSLKAKLRVGEDSSFESDDPEDPISGEDAPLVEPKKKKQAN